MITQEKPGKSEISLKREACCNNNNNMRQMVDAPNLAARYSRNVSEMSGQRPALTRDDAIHAALYLLDEILFPTDNHGLQSLCGEIAQSALRHYYHRMLTRLARNVRNHLYIKRQHNNEFREIIEYLFRELCIVMGHHVAKQIYSKRRAARVEDGNVGTRQC
jgi:hypothetical protein